MLDRITVRNGSSTAHSRNRARVLLNHHIAITTNLFWVILASFLAITERSPDTVACLGSNDLDVLRADCLGSDNLVAGDRDDLVGAAAR